MENNKTITWQKIGKDKQLFQRKEMWVVSFCDYSQVAEYHNIICKQHYLVNAGLSGHTKEKKRTSFYGIFTAGQAKYPHKKKKIELKFDTYNHENSWK